MKIEKKANPSPKDSAIYRIDRGVGFNARVEPFWYTFERLAPRLGFVQRWREKRRLRKVVSEMNEHLVKQGVEGLDWEAQEGGCVCNLRVAKGGLVWELQNCLTSLGGTGSDKKWPHLMAYQDQTFYLLPVEFEEPFELEIVVNGKPIGVGSAVKLSWELEKVNEVLRVEETFALAKLKKVDFLDATENDISMYEARLAFTDQFWPMFSYVMMRKLSDTCVEKNLPVIFA